MRFAKGLAAFLALPLALWGAIGAETASGLHEVQIDPDECYRVRDLELTRGDVRFFLSDGFIAFSKPVAGQPVALIFSTAVEAGDGEVLLLPPNRDERQVLSTHTKAPNLNEHINEAIFFFSDDTAAELKEQMKANAWIHRDPARGAALAAQYGKMARSLIPPFATRMTVDLLNHPNEKNQYFAAVLSGRSLGAFEIIYDPQLPGAGPRWRPRQQRRRADLSTVGQLHPEVACGSSSSPGVPHRQIPH